MVLLVSSSFSSPPKDACGHCARAVEKLPVVVVYTMSGNGHPIFPEPSWVRSWRIRDSRFVTHYKTGLARDRIFPRCSSCFSISSHHHDTATMLRVMAASFRSICHFCTRKQKDQGVAIESNNSTGNVFDITHCTTKVSNNKQGTESADPVEKCG